MAPPPGEHSGVESTAGLESQRSIPTPFLTKTYQLVDDQSIDDVISWNDDGSTFVVWNPTVFSRDLLPKYFKHNNFSSFVRQLNTYGFRKVVPDRWEFANDYFRRGEKRLLCEIQRRKISTQAATTTVTVAVQPQVTVTVTAVPTAKPLTSPSNSAEEQVITSNSSPSTAPAELIDENERLKKENILLTKELAEVKSLCNNIFTLMTNYANNQSKRGFSVTESGLPRMKQPLDLLPVNRFSGEDRVDAIQEETSPRLFGVTIGTKRTRKVCESCSSGSSEDKTILRLQQPDVSKVKSEPSELDHHNNNGDNDETPWLKQCHRTNQRVCN